MNENHPLSYDKFDDFNPRTSSYDTHENEINNKDFVDNVDNVHNHFQNNPQYKDSQTESLDHDRKAFRLVDKPRGLFSKNPTFRNVANVKRNRNGDKLLLFINEEFDEKPKIDNEDPYEIPNADNDGLLVSFKL